MVSASPDAFSVDHRDPLPLYAQLERAIRSSIVGGRLMVGERLPTVRDLAVRLSINANTVARVYATLEQAGVLETRRGVGTFVREMGAESAARRDRFRDLRSLADRIVAEARSLGIGLPELVTHLAQRAKKENG